LENFCFYFSGIFISLKTEIARLFPQSIDAFRKLIGRRRGYGIRRVGDTHPKQIPPSKMAGIAPVGKQNLPTVAIPMAP
jgi:hypothetical protein